MDERKRNWITWSFVALTVLVIAAMMSSTLRRTNRVELPDTDESPDFSAGADAGLTVVEVTPETVQTAIATLHRPEAYLCIGQSVQQRRFFSKIAGKRKIVLVCFIFLFGQVPGSFAVLHPSICH